MHIVSLDGEWQLAWFPEGSRPIAGPADLVGLPVVPARVPGNVELDLVRAGKLADPFVGDHIFDLRPLEFCEWWYRRRFPAPQATGHRVELAFHGLDCFATIWLNGRELGRTANMLVEHRFDVTGLLQADNELVVRLGSAVNAARTHLPEPAEQAMQTNWESLSVRKAPHMYGWDIAPRAVSAGIWRSVELELHEPTELANLYYRTSGLHGDAATLAVQWHFRTDAPSLDGFSLRWRGRCGDSAFEQTAPARFVSGESWLHVPQAKLWWPAGYGDANLYEVTCELLHDGRVVDRRTDQIGLRQVELVRTDVTTPEQPGEFLFRCNGEPIMCKGSNWVPLDAFHSRDAERLLPTLELFADLGCNIVRCWGGNVYEDHPFFDFCDRHGIMVWQDFSLACARYPQDEGFLATIQAEAEQVVRKLRNHASIVLWAGDNECDQGYGGLDPGDNRVTRQAIRNAVLRCDPYRPYLPSSPYMSPEVVRRGRDWRLMPEQHLWGPRDYYKSPFYLDHTAHFASEMGYHGCPNVSSIRRFIEEPYLWPWQDNPQWRTHCTEPVREGGGFSYRIKLMADQIEHLFGFAPDNLDDFALASQICQAEAKKFFVESFRVKKWRRTGVIWWNVMDCWPQFSDAIVDYYFTRKLAYWYLRRVQQPVCLMMDEPENGACRVVAGNDSRRPAAGDFTVTDADTGQALLQGHFETAANANADLGRIPVDPATPRLFIIEWTLDGQPYGNHYLMGKNPISYERYRQWLPRIAGLPLSFDAGQVAR